MLISVIVPIYNTKSNNLRKCIESILNQTHRHLELILVDDCSTDKECLLICNEYSSIDNRIKVIACEQNGGPGTARNRGLEIACGEYVSFIDSDDWIVSNTYESIIQFIIDNNIDTVIYDYNRIYGDKVINVERGLDRSFEYTYRDKSMWRYLAITSELNGPCYITYSKKVIDKYNLKFPQYMKSGEDLFFNIEYFKHSIHGKHFPKSFYNYRFNKESITNVFNTIKFDEYRKIYEIKKQIINEFLHESESGIDYTRILNEEYTKEIFRLTCQALHSNYNVDELCSILESNYIQDVIQTKTNNPKIKVLKLLLVNKHFNIIKIMYEVKVILLKQW